MTFIGQYRGSEINETDPKWNADVSGSTLLESRSLTGPDED
jgi:hypothetical protein